MSVYLTDLDIAEVKQLVVSLGAPAYRAQQLLGLGLPQIGRVLG